ncbi:response regulator transcription factor [Propionimicrobium sp. PCR01-08-3]|uniref:response regulator n=1 Tax=Propionimicrobium sp. PCR01-08-3 TaxID=3052086 RepID=UPI00255C7A7C|nr:response regulator transcription factor [Propionimicrobium sp. PCR01-08-3]WIY83543.1 response regulator transcription factor [Propionimicrobium sp. PCR01-08-3]
MTDTPVRVLLVDDDALVRSGLSLMLGGRDDLHVVGQAGDGRAAVEAVGAGGVDVVLMDVRMPVLDGIEATRKITGSGAATDVLILTTYAEDELVLRALAAGAAGYIVKDSPPAEIVRAVHAVAAGDSVLSPGVTRAVVKALGISGSGGVGDPGRRGARSRLDRLTSREREVAVRLAQGDSNAAIAQRLYMGVPTVKAHVSSILAKTGTTNRVQAALLIHDAGLDPES